uniref:Uncharacterized protein n=1 Tax=Rhizobium laguerreae TaxID=1076926 RepID=A0A6N9ZL89_9HYPH|nr:hypothetical protein [Rhizobium laguerreae]
MRDDDDFTATAKLDRPPGAFLDVDGKARLFENGRATDPFVERFYVSSLHFISDRAAIGPRCPVLARRFADTSSRRVEQRLQGRGRQLSDHAMICSVAAKPPLRHAARKRHAKGKAASNEPARERIYGDLKVVVGSDFRKAPAEASQFPLDPQRRGTFQRGNRGLVCFPDHLGSATFRTDRRSHCLRVFKTDGATLLRLTSQKRCIYKQHAR